MGLPSGIYESNAAHANEKGLHCGGIANCSKKTTNENMSRIFRDWYWNDENTGIHRLNQLNRGFKRMIRVLNICLPSALRTAISSDPL